MRTWILLLSLAYPAFGFTNDKDFEMMVCNAMNVTANKNECIAEAQLNRAMLNESEERNWQKINQTKDFTRPFSCKQHKLDTSVTVTLLAK